MKSYMKKIIFALCVVFIGCKGTSQEKEVSKIDSKKKEQFKVTVPKDIMVRAKKALDRMLNVD